VPPSSRARFAPPCLRHLGDLRPPLTAVAQGPVPLAVRQSSLNRLDLHPRLLGLRHLAARASMFQTVSGIPHLRAMRQNPFSSYFPLIFLSFPTYFSPVSLS